MFKRKTIFDIVKEAEDDQQQSDTAQSQTDQTGDQAPSAEESDAQGAEDAPATEDDDYGSDDDFNIDTSLDDEPDNPEGGNDSGEGTDTNSSDDSSESYGNESEDEPIEANTDIFSSLTAEEQQIKIKELKKLFAEMYSSTDDLLNKINSIDSNEYNIEIMSRISMVMYSLKQYISDYMINTFATKSYIENDIAFNRFLSILNSVSSVIEDLIKIQESNKV